MIFSDLSIFSELLTSLIAVKIKTTPAITLKRSNVSAPGLCMSLNQEPSIAIPIQKNKLDLKIFSFIIPGNIIAIANLKKNFNQPAGQNLHREHAYDIL